MSAFWDSRAVTAAAIPPADTALLGKAATSANEDGKITKAAKDFEAILLGSWFQQAEESFARMPGSEEENGDDGGGSQFMSMAMQSLGSSIASGGGIGIAKMISANLHKTTGTPAAAGTPENAADSTGLPALADAPGIATRLNRSRPLPIK